MRWLCLVLLACGAPATVPDAQDTDSSGTGTPGTPGTPGTTPSIPTPPTTSSASADEELVRELIAGTLSAESAMNALAWGDGLPVHTSQQTVIFVHWADQGSWQVAGDFDQWSGTAMAQSGEVWWAEVPMSTTAGQRYKFVGDGADWIADPWARSYTYDDQGEMSFVDAPTDIWRLDRWPSFAASGLAPRTVRVYVPAGDGPWPTLYMHDGQNLFDPMAMWGGWRMQDALASTDPVLVVGVDNTWDRMDEYTHVPDDIGYGYEIGGGGDAYAAMIHDDLMPHIGSEYGVGSLTGVMGSSLGGLISLHIAQLYPSEFDFAGSLSGTLGWGRFGRDYATMEQLYLAAGPQDTVLYVDSGGDAGIDGQCRDLDGDGFPEDDPDSSDNYCETRQFADAMAGQGYSWQQDLWHWHDAGAEHNEYFWAERVDQPLGVFVGLGG